MKAPLFDYLVLELEGELFVAQEVVGEAVEGRDAVLADGFAMLARGIPHVVLPVVLGILLCQVEHILVAMGLGEDAGSGDGLVFGVALHDAGVGESKTLPAPLFRGELWGVGLEAVAIDDDGFGSHDELVESAMHGEEGGAEDVDAVDLLGGNNAHCPGEGIVLNLLAQFVALLGGELLGVVEGRIVVVGGQDDGGSIDASSQATTACLVAAGLNFIFVEMIQQH